MCSSNAFGRETGDCKNSNRRHLKSNADQIKEDKQAKAAVPFIAGDVKTQPLSQYRDDESK